VIAGNIIRLPTAPKRADQFVDVLEHRSTSLDSPD